MQAGFGFVKIQPVPAAAASSRTPRPKVEKFWNDEIIATLNERIKDREKGIPLKEAKRILKAEIAKYKMKNKR